MAKKASWADIERKDIALMNAEDLRVYADYHSWCYTFAAMEAERRINKCVRNALDQMPKGLNDDDSYKHMRSALFKDKEFRELRHIPPENERKTIKHTAKHVTTNGAAVREG